MHNLHPLVKLAWLFWATIAVFVFDSVVLPFVVAGCAMGLLWLSGVAPWRIPGLRIWVTLSVAILVTHALASEPVDPELGSATGAGLVVASRAAGRLLAVVLVSTLFVTTTEPVSLACALMAVGLPYRWGFALVTALRLVPIFRLEAHHVYCAQMVRGVAYDRGVLRRWRLVLQHLCLPLLVSALRTAHSLSLSMEGRAFGLHRRRTYLRKIVAGRRDVIASGLLIMSIMAAVWRVWVGT